jgi:CRP/FNR family cyclic AMP-dependent transcriptional regulator
MTPDIEENIVTIIRRMQPAMLPGMHPGMLPDDAEIHLVKNHFRMKKVAKKEQLLVKGQIEKYLYFVVKGCLHTFYTTDKGEEFTRCIAMENSFCWSIPSFLRQTPATENIEALTESEILVIDHSSFSKLCQQSPWFRDSYTIALENLCIAYADHIKSFLTMTAAERYRNLLQQNPDIIRQLPNKTVASYLGITQETLSRIKAGR